MTVTPTVGAPLDLTITDTLSLVPHPSSLLRFGPANHVVRKSVVTVQTLGHRCPSIQFSPAGTTWRVSWLSLLSDSGLIMFGVSVAVTTNLDKHVNIRHGIIWLRPDYQYDAWPQAFAALTADSIMERLPVTTSSFFNLQGKFLVNLTSGYPTSYTAITCTRNGALRHLISSDTT